MRTEMREVTVHKEVYIANDGTEFNYLCDCEDYEIRLLEKNLKCYDQDFEEAHVEDCFYVDLTTAEDVENFKLVADHLYTSYSGIDKPGLYMFVDDYRDNNWVNVDEVISKIRKGENND
jgi:hypothetical protein